MLILQRYWLDLCNTFLMINTTARDSCSRLGWCTGYFIQLCATSFESTKHYSLREFHEYSVARIYSKPHSSICFTGLACVEFNIHDVLCNFITRS